MDDIKLYILVWGLCYRECHEVNKTDRIQCLGSLRVLKLLRNLFLTFVVYKSKLYPWVLHKRKGHRVTAIKGGSVLKEYEYTTHISCHDITSGNICAKLKLLAEIGTPILRGLCIFKEHSCAFWIAWQSTDRFNFQQYRMHTDFDVVNLSTY